jgi:hypothetical protein
MGKKLNKDDKTLIASIMAMDDKTIQKHLAEQYDAVELNRKLERFEREIHLRIYLAENQN